MTRILGGAKFRDFLFTADQQEKKGEEGGTEGMSSAQGRTAKEEVGVAPDSPSNKRKATQPESNGETKDDGDDAAPADLDDTDVMEEFDEFLKAANSSERAFVTVFSEEPGRSAKALGPDAVREAVKAADEMIGGLVAKVGDRGLTPVTNFVVVSTPGYADARADGVVTLEKYAGMKFRATGTSPVLQVEPEVDQGECSIRLIYRVLLSYCKKVKQYFYSIYKHIRQGNYFFFRHVLDNCLDFCFVPINT